MKIFTRSLLLIALIVLSNFSFSQKAKDGDYVVGAANSIINTYTYLTANASAGQTSITVNNNAMTGGVFGGALAPGDLIMIIQMQGASVNVNNFPVTDWGNEYTVPNPYLWSFDWPDHIEDWGSLLAPYGAYNNAGKFEQVEVLSVSGANVINLQCGLTNAYIASGHVQIIRVPRFNNLTVTAGSSIIPTLWNGQTGGVVAIEVEATLDINAGAAITASDRGFRGGLVDNIFTPGIGSTTNPAEVRFLGTPNGTLGSEKGESIAGYTTEYNLISSRYGISGIANGGGGGGVQNAGGGGGSNIYTGGTAYTGNGVPPGYVAIWNLDLSGPPLTAPLPIGGTVTPGGGRGGYAISTSDQNETTLGPRNALWGGDARKTNGGRGGHPLAYDATRLFFGGGGGAGDQDSGQGGSGGRGGGIVYITSYGTITGSGAIEANGSAGQNSNPTNQALGFSAYKGNDGAGGGGAGGSIYISNANAIPGTIALNAIGGDGGDQNLQVNIGQPNEAGGPGGSGAGGSIAHNGGAATQNVAAGVGGVTTSTQVALFPPNGATAGHPGVSGLPTKYYDLTSSDVTICAGQTANLSVTLLGTLPVGGTLEWYTQQFGGTPIPGQTGLLTYSPSPAVTTTYYVGVCPGTFRIPITVTVNAGPNLIITDPPAVCAPNTVDITLPAVTAGSDAGPLTYWTDAGATISYGTPTTASNGTYYIQLDLGGGCAVTQPVNVVINPQDDASFTTSPTCDGGTSAVTGTPGGTFAFNPAPGDGAIINASGTVSGGTTGTTYFIQYTTTGACPATLTVPVTAATDLAYTPTLTDENCGAADGVIDLVASGGDGGPYQYSITGGAPYFGSGNFTGLSAGSYSISILDNSGCEITGTEAISGTGGPTIDNVTINDPTCAGACDGSITVSVSGGTPPYSYQWYDDLSAPIGIDSPTLSGQCAGDYSVEVTDASGAVVVLYTQDFDGVHGWNLNVVTGPEGADANFFVVNSNEAGVAPPGCGIAGGADRSLHVTSVFNPAGGAAYDAGGLCGLLFCPQTNRRSESPVISTVGQSGLTLKFDFIANGQAGSDFATVWYNDGFGWTQIGAALSSPLCGGGQGQWTAYSAALPASCDNIPNLQVAIKWQNNDDGAGTDPSVAIDDIEVVAASSACPAIAFATLTDPPAPNLTITDPAAVCAANTVDLTLPAVTAGSDAGTLTYWTDAGATVALATPTAISTSNTYYIQLDVAGCTVIQPVNVVVNPTPNLVITDPTAICAPGTIDLTAAGVTVGSDAGTLTYWDDAGATVSQATPNAVPNGTYYIQLEDGNLCTSIMAVNSVVNPLPNLVITDPSAVCAPSTVDITAPAVTAGSDAGTLTYWDDAGAAVSQPTPNSLGSGTYYIQLEDGNSCTTIQPVVATVTASPNLVITDPSGVCSPNTADITLASVTAGSDVGTLTYWTDVLATSSLVTPTSVGNGTYYIQLDIGGGCTAVQPVNVIVNPLPNLIITDPSPVCDPSTVDITVAGITAGSDAGTLSYWGDAGATIPIPTPNSIPISGIAYIQLVDGNLCSVIQPVNVTVNAMPNLVVTNPSAVCAPGTVDLTSAGVTAGSDAGTLTYWNDAGATVPQATPNAVGSGTYYIQLEDGNTCTTIQSVTATVTAAPNLVITDPSAVCSPGTVDISLPAVTAGSDAGSLTYWTDAGATVSYGAPTTSSTGTYYIQLDLGGGCSVVQPVNVTVNPLPNLVITDPSAVCAPNTVDITGAAVTAGSDAGTLTYWDDAGATIVQGTPGAIGTSGTYYVQLEDGNSCTSIQPVNVVVTSSPNLVITDPAAVCDPNTVDITAAAVTAGSDIGTLTYWDDAGATVSQASPTTLGVGTYYIQLDLGGGCTVVQPVNVTVNALPNLVITDPAGVCSPSTVDITVATVTAGSDAGTLTYWDDAAATISQASPGTVSAGTYYIQLEDGNLCASIQPVNVTVNPLPNLVITDPSAVCAPNTVDITGATVTAGSDAGTLSYWDDAGATIVQGTPGAIGTSGTYYIQLEDGNLCTSIQPVNVVVTSSPNLVITDPVAVCDPNTVDITDPAVTIGSDVGTLTYWDDAGATVSQATPSAVGNGTYYIQLDLGGGCSVVQPVNVVVNALPNLVITDPLAVCEPNTIDITTAAVTAGSDAGTLTYWNDAGATISQAAPSAANNGVYYIQLTDGNACSVISAVNAVVNPMDDASFTATPTCDGAIVVIDGLAGGVFSFAVAPADGALVDVNTGDVTNGNSLTQYTIQYTTNGVCPSSSIESITSLDCTVDPEIIIPTAFTPDGDGVNDTWEILGLDTNYPNNIVRIYNRWGALIYEHEASISDTYGMNEWDGTFNGQKLPVSSFYYIIDYNDGSETSVKGTVTLVEM